MSEVASRGFDRRRDRDLSIIAFCLPTSFAVW